MAPTPTGAPTLPSEATGQAYTEQYFQQLFASKYGAKAGDAYVAYNRAHPGNSAYTNARNFLELILVEGLDNAISTGLGGAGSALGQIPSAAAQGAQNAYKALTAPLTGINAIGDFFSRLTSAHTWIRIGEFIVGAALLAIGLNALLKQTTGVDVGKSAVKAAKAVRV